MTLAMGKIYDEHHKVQEDEPMLEEKDGQGDMNRHVIKQCKTSHRNGMKLVYLTFFRYFVK